MWEKYDKCTSCRNKWKRKDLKRFKKLYTKKCVIDLHAPGHSGGEIHNLLPRAERPVEQREAALFFSSFLASSFPTIKKSILTVDPKYPSRWNADAMISSWVWDRLDQTPCVTIETSYQSIAGRQLDIKGYREIGKKVALTVRDWFIKR